MELRSARRKFRTRPSSVRPVIINAEDITRFVPRNIVDVDEDASYELNTEPLAKRPDMATSRKRARPLKKKKSKRRPRRQKSDHDFDSAKVREAVALFNEVSAFSLKIEQVVEDGYVMHNPEASVSHVETVLHASTSGIDSFIIDRKSAAQNSRNWSICESPDNNADTPSKQVLPVSRFSTAPLVTSTPMAGIFLPKKSVFQPSTNESSSTSSTISAEVPACNVSLVLRKSLAANNPRKRFYYLRDFDEEPTDLNFLLHACEPRCVISWDEFLPKSTRKGIRKLGEGAYGEVFKTKVHDVPVALKIIPFMDKKVTHNGLVNGEHMKHTMEILPELLITKELSELGNVEKQLASGYLTPSFVRLVQTSVVKGNYPNELLTEWDRFARVTDKSENDRPDKYASEEQLFIVFALSLGGKDLESYTIKNEREAWSIFFQIALSLAVAEETIEFEHRDLHWGNVLIDTCKAATPIKYVLNNRTIVMKACGVSVSIIDFTNSRMQREGTIIYLDLSKDEELFKGEGDYQFDVYRMMREANKDKWQYFTPFTNNIWLHYIATKVFASTKIAAKRQREVLSIVDRVLKCERIINFLEDEEIAGIFEGYLLKEVERLSEM